MENQGTESSALGAAPRRGRRGALLLLLAGAVALTAWFVWFRERAPLPEIDTANASPQLVEAIGEARAAVRRQPGSGEAWGRLGMILLAHQYNPQASECFLQAQKLDPEAARWPYFGALAIYKYDPLRAIGLLERAVAADKDEPTFRLLLGEFLQEQGRAREAEQNFLRVLSDKQLSSWGHLRLAQVALGEGNLPKAQEHAQHARAGAAPFKALLVLEAEIAFRTGHAKEAERLQQEALTLPTARWYDPYMAQVERLKVEVLPQLAQAKQLASQGQAREGIALLEQIVYANPRSVPARVSLARALVDLREWEAAAAACKEALALKDDDAVALNLLGFALSRQGQLRQAVACYEKSFQLNPHNAETQYHLGYCYHQLGEKQAAVEALRIAVGLRPDFANAWRELGQFFVRADDAEALACFRRAVELAPRDEGARKLLEDTRKRLAKTK